MKNTINDMQLSPHLASPSEAALSHLSKLDGLHLSPHLASPSEAALSHLSKLDGLHLSPHFTLAEFCKPGKYPDNIPSSQHVENMVYGCHNLLEPAREAIGCPILVSSGFRNEAVNRKVGGVPNSQHKKGQAADIRPKDPAQFQHLVDFLRRHPLTDQLLTGNGWLHISWNPSGPPRHFVRIGYYK